MSSGDEEIGARIRLTRMGLGVLATGLVSLLWGLATQQDLGLWLAILCLSQVAVSAFVTWLPLAGLDVRLEVPRTAYSGTHRSILATVVNQGLWPLWGYALSLSIGETFQASVEDPELLTAGTYHQTRTDSTLRCRGQFPVARVHLTSRPLGLAEGLLGVVVPIDLTVFPSVQVLEREPVPPGSPHSPAGDGVLDRHGDSVEFLGIREYAQGDSYRLVHWASVARTGRLLVKDFARPSETDVTMLLDLIPAGLPYTRGTNEDLIRVAASLCFHFHQRCLSTQLVVGSLPELVVPPGNGDYHHNRLQTGLACCGDGGGQDLESTVHHHESRLRANDMLLVICPWENASTSLGHRMRQVAVRGVHSVLVRLLPEGPDAPVPGISGGPVVAPEGGPSAEPRGAGTSKVFDLHRPLRLRELLEQLS